MNKIFYRKYVVALVQIQLVLSKNVLLESHKYIRERKYSMTNVIIFNVFKSNEIHTHLASDILPTLINVFLMSTDDETKLHDIDVLTGLLVANLDLFTALR